MNCSPTLLERVLPACVALKATIPEAHPSAQILGTERLGSGVIVDRAGLILTVNYVVLGTQSLEVMLADDTRMPGRIAAQDFVTGLAVVDVGQTLPVAMPLCASTDLQVGQDVFIVAAVAENARRANDGGITSLGRFDAYWEYSLERAIITSAMNPGVGGGPLFDRHGHVAGIVSLDLNEIGRCSLAVPTEPFLEHRDELLRFGRRVSRPTRAWIGFYCYTFREHVVIAGVLPGAPGEQAGLKAGDVLVAVDGQRVSDRHELYAYLWSHRSGDLINFQVFRNNQVEQVAVASGNAEEFFA